MAGNLHYRDRMKEGRPYIPARVREVLEHFRDNPKYQGAIQDMAQWRLPQEAIRISVDEVAKAVSWLVVEGFLMEERPTGVGALYRLNPARAGEIDLFLGERSKHPYVDAEETPLPERRLLTAAIAWIDAALVQYLRENPLRQGEQPLTRSYESLEALLRGPLAETPGDVETARRTFDETSRALSDACEADAGDEALGILHGALNLTWLELETVLLCLAPELDAKYQIAFGVLNDDMGRRAPTLGLICRMLGAPLAVRTELESSGRLTRWRLLASGAVLPHADEPLRLDPALISWLLGVEGALTADARLASMTRSEPWPGGAWMTRPADLMEIERLSKRFHESEPGRRWLALSGEDADGWRAIVEAGAERAGTPLILVTAPETATGEVLDADDAAARVARAAVLLDGEAVLDFGAGGESTPQRNSLFSRVAGALAAARRPGVLIAPDLERILAVVPREGCEVARRDAPDQAAIAGIYAEAAAAARLEITTTEAEQLAMSFPLTVGAIDAAVRVALLEGADRLPATAHFAALTAACRRVASPELPRFARRIQPAFGLEDVVLPQDRLDQLREIVAHVKFAARVMNTWGFSEKLPYGRGVAALFSGPSGTGKTMAAQAIARELNTETYVVDLSRVISKYIGETEKFIDATFRDAQRAGAVLQIDEAEALFGKRSEIKDAHDRYANIEVAYLLQRMEIYDGVAILTTNLRQNLDQAFLRRLRFVVDFPKPDAAAREQIWLRCLPQGAPFHNVEMGIRFLARRLELTGGNIRQIAVRAAFAAAAEGSETIEMRHLIQASRAELLKLGMPAAERELAEFEAAQRQAAKRVA